MYIFFFLHMTKHLIARDQSANRPTTTAIIASNSLARPAQPHTTCLRPKARQLTPVRLRTSAPRVEVPHGAEVRQQLDYMTHIGK